MTQVQNIIEIPISKKGSHLSYKEMCKIEAWSKDKLSNREIARRLNRAPQTINNAIKAGSVTQVREQKRNEKAYRYTNIVYLADVHFLSYEKNRANCGRKPKWLDCEDFLNWVDKKILEDKWSPDACVGYAKRKNLYSNSEIPSTKSLYHWIDSGIMKARNIDLLEKLSRKPNNNEPKSRRNKRILGESIEKRPKEVDIREEFGHWEIDTVLGLKKASDPVLLTLVERKTRFEWMLKIAAKTEEAVDKALSGIFANDSSLKKKIFKSFTADNGSEFAGLSGLIESLKVYFCHPYASHERGSSENQHKLIRRFIPKGTPIEKVSDNKIKRIIQWINDYPRRILGYDTAYNVFMKEVRQLDLSPLPL